MFGVFLWFVAAQVTLDSVRTLYREGRFTEVLRYAREGKDLALDPRVREAYAYLEVLSLYQLQRWPEVQEAARGFLETYPRGVRRGYVAYAGARAALAQQAVLPAFRFAVDGFEDAETRELQAKMAGVVANLWGTDTATALKWLQNPVFRRRAREETRDLLVWLPLGGERHPVGRAFVRGLRLALGEAAYRLRIASGQHPELVLKNNPPLLLVGPLLSRDVGPLYPLLEREVIPTLLPLSMAPMKPTPPWILYHLSGDLRFVEEAARLLTEIQAETVVVLFEQPPYEVLARRLKRMLPRKVVKADTQEVVVRLFPMEHRTSSVLEKLDLVRTMQPPWVVVLAESEVMEWITQAHARDSLPGFWIVPPHTRGTPPPGYAARGTLMGGWNDLARARRKVRSLYRSRYHEEMDRIALRGYDVGWMIREALKARPRNGLELALWLHRRGVFYGLQSTWVFRSPEPFWITQPDKEEEHAAQGEGAAAVP